MKVEDFKKYIFTFTPSVRRIASATSFPFERRKLISAMEEKDSESEKEAGLLCNDDEEYQFGGSVPKFQFRWSDLFQDMIVRVKLMFLTIVFSLFFCV